MLNLNNFKIENINFDEKYVELSKDDNFFKIFAKDFSNEKNFYSNVSDLLYDKTRNIKKEDILEFFNTFKDTNIEYFFFKEEDDKNIEGKKCDIYVKILGFKNDGEIVEIKPISSIFKKEEDFYPVMDFDITNLLSSSNYKEDILRHVENYLLEHINSEKNNPSSNIVKESGLNFLN